MSAKPIAKSTTPKGRPRKLSSPAATEIKRGVERGLFGDELLGQGHFASSKGGGAVDDVGACYREALAELNKILARDLPKRDRDALDEALTVYRNRRRRGQTPPERPSQLIADVRSGAAELVEHLATVEAKHPHHRLGEACLFSPRPAPPESPDDAVALRLYLVGRRGDDRALAIDAMRRVLWRAAERLRARGLLTAHT